MEKEIAADCMHPIYKWMNRVNQYDPHFPGGEKNPTLVNNLTH
jgi:hypothetical protein